MAEKFLRSGQCSLEVSPAPTGAVQNLTIPQGLRIEFDITRGSISQPQNALIRVHGLSKTTRGLIYKDPFATISDRALQLWAGYQGINPMIFNGTVFSAFSTRQEGGTEWVTELRGYDGAYGMVNGYTSGWGAPNTPVPPGTTADTIIRALGGAASFPGLTGEPIVGSFPTANLRSEVLFGNTWQIIQQKAQGQAIIDNGQIKALNINEALVPDGLIPVFDSSTGLLGEPRRSGAFLEWDILFEPRLTVFQLVQLQSPDYNGIFKVMGFRHQGVIDTTDDGPYKTTIQVYSGYGPINPATGSPFSTVGGNLVQ